MPTKEKVEQYIGAISSLYENLPNAGYVGDGLKILICKAGDQLKQSGFYNGWKCDHYITNLYVFGPDGTILAALLNCPGSMHDSELAGIGMPSIYAKIDNHYEEYGVVCVMDSAFAARTRPSIIKSVPRERIDLLAEGREQALMWDDALSVRQSAEWGMRALQGSMPRLKARWHYEERDERMVGLHLISFLHNYKANNMDLNQIRAVYWNPYQDAIGREHDVVVQDDY